jgi:hypothetical protein
MPGTRRKDRLGVGEAPRFRTQHWGSHRTSYVIGILRKLRESSREAALGEMPTSSCRHGPRIALGLGMPIGGIGWEAGSVVPWE